MIKSNNEYMKKENYSQIVLRNRLRPLYLAAFLHGFVLWYVIEKLYMRSIGFDDTGIGFMVASYSAVMLLVETPSGILADRWSRKGVLMLASIALAASGLICGISTEPLLYLVGAWLWGVFYALYSGTYDSIVYDTVVEETGKSDGYETYYGKIRLMDSIALVLGSFVGSVLGQVSSLPIVYFASIPLALCALIALWRFKEPQLHKAQPFGSIKEHIIKTFLSVLGNGMLVKLLVVIVVLTLINEVIYEFSQLWLIAIAVPPLFFGPANALLLSSIGIGGLLSGRFAKHRQVVIFTAFVSMLLSSLGLIFFHDLILIALFQTIVGTGTIVLSIIFMKELHDLLPSHVRSGSSSAVSTMSRLALIPTALLFGFISSHGTVFLAGWILVGLVLLSSALAFYRRSS
jgi:predicted MFS family arabinose efflux permease